MPDIAAHNLMGYEVLRQLDTEISSKIDKDVFRFAVMGPDIYMYYRFFLHPFRHGINYRSNLMHHVKTGDFLGKLSENCTNPEDFSLFAGFLCHYILDETVHPMIEQLSDHTYYLHRAIERKIDVYELKRIGKQTKDVMRFFAPVPDLTKFQKVLFQVYGWKDSRFQTSYRHMKLYHRIAKDSYGLFYLLTHRISKVIASVSFRNRLPVSVNMSEYEKLRKEAVRSGVRQLTKAFCEYSENKEQR